MYGRNKVHIEYGDGTHHHCSLGQLDGLPAREDIRQPIMSAEMPEIENDVEDVDDEDPPLALEEACKYLAIATRFNYLAPHRVDIQYAVKGSS